jgi:hypothetical protein
LVQPGHAISKQPINQRLRLTETSPDSVIAAGKNYHTTRGVRARPRIGYYRNHG